jgi:hypothetical protein
MRKLRAPRAHPSHDRVEVDRRRRRVHAEAAGATDLAHRPRRTQQRFRGNAPGVEAIAAEKGALDQSHTRPKTSRGMGGDESGGAAADHDQMVGVVRDVASFRYATLSSRGQELASRGSTSGASGELRWKRIHPNLEGVQNGNRGSTIKPFR